MVKSSAAARISTPDRALRKKVTIAARSTAVTRIVTMCTHATLMLPTSNCFVSEANMLTDFGRPVWTNKTMLCSR
jgi:hypothetical protein